MIEFAQFACRVRGRTDLEFDSVRVRWNLFAVFVFPIPIDVYSIRANGKMSNGNRGNGVFYDDHSTGRRVAISGDMTNFIVCRIEYAIAYY